MSSTTTPPRSVLGKGLGSLLPPVVHPGSLGATSSVGASEVTSVASQAAPGGVTAVTSPVAANSMANKDRHPGISLANIDEIKANEFQPRRDFDPVALEELAQSIRENGLIQPLVVRKNGDHYELIAGERRLRASKLAGLRVVPIVIRKSTDREALELAIVENIQREDLNCVDEGLAYFQLMQEFQLSQEELAKKMGKDRATIANALRILKLSDFILNELKKGSLSRGHAKALLSVEDPVRREKFAQEILEKNWSVRQAERTAQELKTSLPTSPTLSEARSTRNTGLSPELMSLQQELTRRYMAKVELKGTKKSGTIQVQFSSEAELNRIYSLLMGDRA
jgi:ParB family chromosome partitioning protein